MKLPNFKRVITSDYKPEFRSLVETLSFSINNGIEVLYQTLNRAVSLRDNVACTVRDIVVEVAADGTPKARTTFSLDTNNRTLGIVVLNAINNRNPLITPNSGVFVVFSQDGRTITITNIKGLPADQQFTLSMVAFDS